MNKTLPPITSTRLFLLALLALSTICEAKASFSHSWQFPPNPQLKLVTVWAVYQVDGKKIDDIAYGCGVSDDKPMTKTAQVYLGVKGGNNQVRVVFDSAGEDKMSRDVPEGARLRERPLPNIDKVTADYQVLWIADWVKDGKVVKSIAYTVRGLQVNDKTSGLDEGGVVKLKKALLDAESTATAGPSSEKH